LKGRGFQPRHKVISKKNTTSRLKGATFQSHD